MSERGKDKGKQPRKKTVPTRSSSRILAVGPVNYKEVELTTSEEDSEGTLEGSESGFGSIKLEGEAGEQETLLLESTWMPRTAKHSVAQVGNRLHRMAEENRQLRMTTEVEKTSVEKMMELMTMRMEDQKREQLGKIGEKEKGQNKERGKKKGRKSMREGKQRCSRRLRQYSQ